MSRQEGHRRHNRHGPAADPPEERGTVTSLQSCDKAGRTCVLSRLARRPSWRATRISVLSQPFWIAPLSKTCDDQSLLARPWMAGFKTHIATSTLLGIGYGGAAYF